MRSALLLVGLLLLFAGIMPACSSGEPRVLEDGDSDDLDAETGESDEAEDSERESSEEDGERFDPTALDYPYCPIHEDEIEAVYDRLSVRQRIGQHLLTGISRAGERVKADDEQRIRTYFLGGGFVSQITGIAIDASATSARFLHHAQTIAADAMGVPLFISSDQEGGVYTSVNHMTGGTDTIGPAAIGATKDPWVAFQQFDMMGREVKALGINMNFGPLLDTHYNRDSGNLNTRTFGPDVDLNTSLGLAAFSGFQHNLVIPTVKHFPGDGVRAVNTHHEYSINTASRDELEATLLKPFRAAFASGSDAVMIIPAQHTALDDQRAAITSRKVMHDLLRGELGFDGLIVTDDLNMYGARLGLTEDQEQGYEALKAGADILLYVAIDDAYLGTLVAQIETGLQSGDIDGAEFAASTKRILRYKQKYCLFEKPTYPDEDDMATLQDRIGLAEDSDLSLRHAEGAVVLLQNDGVLPLHDRRVLCIGPDTVLPDPASGWSWLIEESFCSVMKRMHPSVSVKPYIVGLSEGSALEWAVANHAQSDVIVVATFQSYFSSEQQSLLHGLIHLSGPPVVHVAQGVAFDAIQTRDKVAAIVLLQGSLPVMFEAGVRVLWGDAQPGGHLLYDLGP